MGVHLPVVDIGSNSMNIQTIKTGYYHTCAILTTNEVKCWGLTLISDMIIHYPRTVDFGSTMQIYSLHTGSEMTCFVLEDMNSLCFGRNHRGQLGPGLCNRGALVTVGNNMARTDLGNPISNCSSFTDEYACTPCPHGTTLMIHMSALCRSCGKFLQFMW